MLTLAGWQEDLCALKLWPEQARANRMMWLMDSDLVGLRTSADAGLSLNDCSDLFIHQADCDKVASAAQSRRRNFPRPRCCSKAFASPQEGEGHPAELRAVGLLLEIWTLSKLWADLVYGGGGRQVSDRPGRRTWHSRSREHVQTVCGSFITLIHEEAPPSAQSSGKLYLREWRMHQHCVRNKRQFDESPTKHVVSSQTISGKWCLNECLMRPVESTYVLDKKKPLQYFA